MARFTVDTHLFRELGELLVGRDSTALIELIKNAYDADATEVTVLGEGLEDPGRGSILVTDNGVGMSTQQFENGFLRVASRLKDQGERRSMLFQRRYTGAKGIGRLAAHKLARKLEVDSVWRSPGQEERGEALYAAIDWDEIERYETLDQIESTDAIVLGNKKARKNAPPGTTLILSRLRRAWTPAERARFFAEVQSFDPPAFLYNPLPPSVIGKSLLFDTPFVRDQGTRGSTSPFQVKLEGDFAVGESYWALVAEMANWVLEIRAAPNDERVAFAISPTKKTLRANRQAKPVHQTIPHPTPERGPHFDARILVREGNMNLTRDQRVWATRTSGVRVYMEGFRVLPYGETSDDWLSIDADYTRRPRQLEMLRDLRLGVEAMDADAGLNRVPNNNYFGAVFLTQERCPSLRVLVNREGFVPEASFDTLVSLVRTGIDLCTRTRAAAAYPRRVERKEARRRESKVGEFQKERAQDNGVEELALPDRLRGAVQLMKKARESFNEGNAAKAEIEASEALREFGETTDLVADLWSERSLLLVLASVGTQMAAFVHEINGLLGMAQVIESALEQIIKTDLFPREDHQQLTQTLSVIGNLKQGLERQAAYLMELEIPDSRRRRSRQRLSDRFNAAVGFIRHQAERRHIDIENRIPSDLTSIPMFPAEITAVFANLLTNAVKAIGEDGRIRASASVKAGQIRILLQNTGVAVDLDEAEHWFRPFESTTTKIDPVLGQGMGLGLTITRNLLDNYGAAVSFVQPKRPFKTAVEVSFPSGSHAS